MHKVIIATGSFDCLASAEMRLLKYMKGLAIPDGKVKILVYSDIVIYQMFNKFPVQTIDHRVSNLELVVGKSNVDILWNNNEDDVLKNMIEYQQELGNEVTYISTDTNRNFKARNMLKKIGGVRIKFVDLQKLCQE